MSHKRLPFSTRSSLPLRLASGACLSLSLISSALANGYPVLSQEQAQAASLTTVSVWNENDFWINSDRYYTNGSQLTVVFPDIRTLGDGISDSSSFLIKNGPFSESEDTLYRYSAGISQDIYTDDDVEFKGQHPIDRPFAGWLRFDVGLRSTSATRMDVVEVSLGLVGPWTGAEEIQSTIHEIIQNPDPQGWETQIKNEPAAQLTWIRYWKFREDFDSDIALDATPMAGATVGNVFIYGITGLTLRYGLNLPYDYGRNRVMPGNTQGDPYSDADHRLSEDGDWTFYGVLGFDVRAVGRNIFLDGNTIGESYSVNKEPIVANTKIGAALGCGPFILEAAYVSSSKEFEDQRDWHSYGQVNTTFVF